MVCRPPLQLLNVHVVQEGGLHGPGVADSPPHPPDFYAFPHSLRPWVLYHCGQTRGTVTKWLKAEGDEINEYDAILELSTASLYAPGEAPVEGEPVEMIIELAEYGFVGKLFVAEGDTVEVRVAFMQYRVRVFWGAFPRVDPSIALLFPWRSHHLDLPFR